MFDRTPRKPIGSSFFYARKLWRGGVSRTRFGLVMADREYAPKLAQCAPH